MFANRFTAFIDACSLVPTLNRDLLLSLAEADFFRVRWSERVLDETEAAVAKVMTAKGKSDVNRRAHLARSYMERAFADAMVTGYEALASGLTGLPDPGDAHVIAAAVKTRASVIVTENLKHFPEAILAPLDIEAKSADGFIADTIGLDRGRAVAAIKQMRERYRKPELDAEALLLRMDAVGLIETVDALREHVRSL